MKSGDVHGRQEGLWPFETMGPLTLPSAVEYRIEPPTHSRQLRDENAIVLPSGDQAGPNSDSVVVLVRLSTPLPFAFTSEMSGTKSGPLLVKAILSPEGDHTGPAPLTPSSVNLVRLT